MHARELAEFIIAAPQAAFSLTAPPVHLADIMPRIPHKNT
jgi:hypothetical protein